MAFETVAGKQAGIQRAITLLHQIRQIYAVGKSVQQLLADYQAGTDPALNATINALLSSAERTEISQMLAQIDALIVNWEANHPQAIGLTP